MVIDTDEIHTALVGFVKAGTTAFQNMGWFEVGVTLLTVGTLAAIRQTIVDWRKRKGFRMAVRERTTKETELLSQIINDGLFEAEMNGKISEQRMKALYKLCSDKLDLPDLVPKQVRLKIVKEEVKRRLIESGKLDPKTLGKTKFSETIGGFAKKFWKKAA